MIYCRYIVFLIVGMFLGACAPSQQEYLAQHRDTPYFFRLTTLEGAPSTIEAYRGRKSLFLFWAQHCMRSRWLMKEVSEKTVSGEIPSSVAVVAVNIDTYANFPKVQKFLEGLPPSRIEVMYSGNDKDDEAYGACGGNAIPLVVTFDESLMMQTRGLAGEGLSDALAYLSQQLPRVPDELSQ